MEIPLSLFKVEAVHCHVQLPEDIPSWSAINRPQTLHHLAFLSKADNPWLPAHREFLHQRDHRKIGSTSDSDKNYDLSGTIYKSTEHEPWWKKRLIPGLRPHSPGFHQCLTISSRKMWFLKTSPATSEQRQRIARSLEGITGPWEHHENMPTSTLAPGPNSCGPAKVFVVNQNHEPRSTTSITSSGLHLHGFLARHNFTKVLKTNKVLLERKAASNQSHIFHREHHLNLKVEGPPPTMSSALPGRVAGHQLKDQDAQGPPVHCLRHAHGEVRDTSGCLGATKSWMFSNKTGDETDETNKIWILRHQELEVPKWKCGIVHPVLGKSNMGFLFLPGWN